MSETKNEFLQGQLVEGVSDGWQITDDKSADWAVRKIVEARKDTERWKEYYKQQEATIKSGNEGTEAFFVAKLREYFGAVPHKATKTQEKYTLPSGDLVLKQQSVEFDMTDEAMLIAWCKANGMEQFVKVKETVDWAGLKKLIDVSGDMVCIKETGEALPGIKANARDEKFTISVKGEK